MNDELISKLKNERNKLYPNGCLIQGRRCGKTYLYLSHFLRWNAYELYMQVYKVANYKVSLEQAHKEINGFVVAQMPEWVL